MTKIVVCSQSDFTTDYRIYKLSSSLRGLGYDVTFLGRRHHKHRCKETNDTHLLNMFFERSVLFYLEFNIRLFFYCLTHRADMVVAIDLDTLAGVSLAAKLTGQKVLFDSHEYFPESPEIAHKPFVKWVWRVIQRLFVPLADIHVTVCQSIADIFKRKYGRDFLVVRNVPLQERNDELKRLIATEGQTQRPFTILYQGAVNIGRGIETVIEALVELKECSFVVVGDGDILDEVKALAVSLGVSDRVSFEGKKPYSELVSYMAKADLGVCFFENLSLNYYYCLPNRLFDFIGAQLPMLVIDFPELRRVVETYEIGECLSDMTVKTITSAIRRAMTDKETVSKWRANMVKASEELVWEREIRPLTELLKGVLKE